MPIEQPPYSLGNWLADPQAVLLTRDCPQLSPNQVGKNIVENTSKIQFNVKHKIIGKRYFMLKHVAHEIQP